MKPLDLGNVRIDRILEQEGTGFEPTYFFPDATIDGFLGESDWLMPHFWDAEANTYIRSIQSFRGPHRPSHSAGRCLCRQ